MGEGEVILLYAIHGGRGKVWKLCLQDMTSYAIYPSESYMYVPGSYKQMMEDYG